MTILLFFYLRGRNSKNYIKRNVSKYMIVYVEKSRRIFTHTVIRKFNKVTG